MANLVIVNSELHRKLRIVTRASVEIGDNIGLVSVIPREYPRLLAHYPIFFRKSAQTGQFEPAALLGFTNTENLFLAGDRWDAGYVPLQIQRQPFSVIPNHVSDSGAERSRFEVALDTDSPRVRTDEGEVLFSEDGRPSKYLQKITAILSEFVAGASEAFAFTAKLAGYNLIEPYRIEVEFVDGSQGKLQGLYSISGENLQALPAAQLAELRDLGFLEWTYYQLASLAHLSGLVARKNRLLIGMTASTLK